MGECDDRFPLSRKLILEIDRLLCQSLAQNKNRLFKEQPVFMIREWITSPQS